MTESVKVPKVHPFIPQTCARSLLGVKCRERAEAVRLNGTVLAFEKYTV